MKQIWWFVCILLLASCQAGSAAPGVPVEVTRVVEATRLVVETQVVEVTRVVEVEVTRLVEPAATETPVPSAKLGAVGDRIEAGGIALTVKQVKRLDSVNDYSKAEAGNEFLVVEVLTENVGLAAAPYNPMYFKLKDDQGYEYYATSSAPEPSLKSGELAKGESARGWIAVEIPKGAKGLVLTEDLTLTVVDQKLQVSLME
jgi:hypothetical protein